MPIRGINRSTNFSFTEDELLLKLSLEAKTVLESKQSNCVSWNDENRTRITFGLPNY